MKTKQVILGAFLSLIVSFTLSPLAIAQIILPAGSYINIATPNAAPYTVRYEENTAPVVESMEDTSNSFSINGGFYTACLVGDVDCTPGFSNRNYNFELSYDEAMGELSIRFVPGSYGPILNLNAGEFSLLAGSTVIVEVADATVTVGNNPSPASNTAVGAAAVEYRVINPLDIRFNAVDGGDPVVPGDPVPTPSPTPEPDEFVDVNSGGGCHLTAAASGTGLMNLLATLMMGLSLWRFNASRKK